MPPAQVFNDGQAVTLHGPVLFATFGPSNVQPNDVTQAVRNIQIGHGSLPTVIKDIHAVLPSPNPGLPSQLRVWYVDTPSQTFSDHTDIVFNGLVLYATYDKKDAKKPKNDVTDKVREQQAMGRGSALAPLTGGIHLVVGDPHPMVPKLLRVWTA